MFQQSKLCDYSLFSFQQSFALRLQHNDIFFEIHTSALFFLAEQALPLQSILFSAELRSAATTQ
jgi:hypothetical protein